LPVSEAVPESPARSTDRLPTVSPSRFNQLAIASLVATAAIILTGAAVRLTGSGLGCPDWPSCYHTRLTPNLSFHPVVEFSNRLVTVVIVVVVAITFLAAFRRRPFRRDLAWLSGGLVVGVLGQAVIGGIVVYTKLNPYLVMVHFMYSALLVANAVVLVHRARRNYSAPGTLLAPRVVLLLSRGVLALLAIVIAAGTATTGAGPHAGNSSGQQVAKRLPVALRQMAELHSSLALLLIGVVISLAVVLHAIDVPESVRRAGRLFTVTLMAQAVVGYTQYFTHLPAGLVEVHIVGVTILVVGAVQFSLALTHHRAEGAVPLVDRHNVARPSATQKDAERVASASW
jgi:cytochrome c oxidase assembly protein subunit 15